MRLPLLLLYTEFDTVSAPPNIATGQVSLSPDTPVQIVAARVARVELFLTVVTREASVDIGDSGLTTANGFTLRIDPTTPFRLESAAQIFAVARGAPATVSFIEIYT